MSNARNLLILLVLACSSLSYAGDSAAIDRSGRRIQLDGFLMDWIEKNKRPWNGSAEWCWDAINTPEGVAGYFHARSARCSSWTFYIDPGRHAAMPWKWQAGVTGSAESQIVKANSSSNEGTFVVAIEWIIPWDSLSIDSSGTYTINMVGKSTCGDTLQPLLITGSVPRRSNWLPPRFTERIILIGALFLTFIVLQRKIRKKSRRKGSPHRSA